MKLRLDTILGGVSSSLALEFHKNDQVYLIMCILEKISSVKNWIEGGGRFEEAITAVRFTNSANSDLECVFPFLVFLSLQLIQTKLSQRRAAMTTILK